MQVCGDRFWVGPGSGGELKGARNGTKAPEAARMDSLMKQLPFGKRGIVAAVAWRWRKLL